MMDMTVISSGGRVSKFCRSVIRHSPAAGPPVPHHQSVIISGRPSPSVVSPSLRHRYFHRVSVIAKLQFVTGILGPSVKNCLQG